MFGNYTNYLKYLVYRLPKIITGKYKLFTKVDGYGDDKVKVIVLKPNEELDIPEDIVIYRVYWKDGTKSRWFIPGINEIGDFSKTHTREYIVKL